MSSMEENAVSWHELAEECHEEVVLHGNKYRLWNYCHVNGFSPQGIDFKMSFLQHCFLLVFNNNAAIAKYSTDNVACLC